MMGSRGFFALARRLEFDPSTPKGFVYSLEGSTQPLDRRTWICPGGASIRFTAILPDIGR